MRLHVIGSADAFNSSGRGHSCYVLDGFGSESLMIDFGATALAGLRRAGRDPRSIGSYLFTHLHGDHIGGLPFLLIDGMYHDVRESPLELCGPTGMADKVSALFRHTYGALADEPRPYAARVREIAVGDCVEVAGVVVDAFAADHMDPPDIALCLRLSSRSGKRVAFSGDTRMCEGLRQAARGVDLLVAECTCLAPPCGRHCTWEDWLRELSTIGARSVLLSHLSDAVRDRVPELQAQAPAGVRLAFADDGLVVEL